MYWYCTVRFIEHFLTSISDQLFRSDAAGVAALVDPIDLSLRQLRWLLHARGISYYGAIEKKDLSDYVAASGVVTTVRSLFGINILARHCKL